MRTVINPDFTVGHQIGDWFNNVRIVLTTERRDGDAGPGGGGLRRGERPHQADPPHRQGREQEAHRPGHGRQGAAPKWYGTLGIIAALTACYTVFNDHLSLIMIYFLICF